MLNTHERWVFLGDSLTEGIGSRRISYVSELVELMRTQRSNSGENQPLSINYFRARSVNPDTFNYFIRTNIAGNIYIDESYSVDSDSIWIWNLASESTTIEDDYAWIPLIATIQPTRIFVFRGSFESILRPRALFTNSWPWWVPGTWRGTTSLDPRCYFSSALHRRLKQKSVDALKQRIRLSLLKRDQSAPLLEQSKLIANVRKLVLNLLQICSNISVIGLLPVSDKTFPNSSMRFKAINCELQVLSKDLKVEFIDWSRMLDEEFLKNGLYADGFHPNQLGARMLARVLNDLHM